MKTDRTAIYNKYKGHCAYCGQEINQKDMQVDHIIPLHLIKTGEINKRLKPRWSRDSEENLNPSCRRCNHYKRGLTLENFREQLKTLHTRIEKQYITKVGIDYGIVTIKPFNGEFYFEFYNLF